MAQHNEFTWFRGEDILITFTLSPVENISGWTIKFVMKKDLADAAPLLNVTAAVTDAANGVFTVPVTAAQNTTLLSAGAYLHAAERIDTGSVAMLSEGPVNVKSSAKQG